VRRLDSQLVVVAVGEGEAVGHATRFGFSRRCARPLADRCWEIILSYFLRSELSHIFPRKKWPREEAGISDSMTAVAAQECLHFAATRDAKAAPEPKRFGMRSRGASGSKSTTVGVGSASDEEAEVVARRIRGCGAQK
jgi:hypothetical protein